MTYRSEIDGLRSIAVVSVILFNAGVSGLSGGFVGVDIFFVISGFLITGLILRDQDKGHFSLVEFYQRRARRLLPALLVMVIVTLLVGILVFPPMQLQWLAQSAFSTGLFAANLYFMVKGGDYFAQDAFFPLKHAWSLGVEEQFYFVFPALMVVALHWGGTRARARTIWIGFFLSLALTINPWANTGDAHYYNPIFRAWELLGGAILALLPRIETVKTTDNVLGTLGLFMIIASIVGYDETVPFPSLWTCVPVFGTMLMIRHVVSGSLLAQVLKLGPLVGLGKISYGLYLWHYPMMIFAKYYGVDTSRPVPLAILLIAIYLVSLVSFHLIERPIRFGIKNIAHQDRVAIGLLSVSALVVCAGLWVNATGGLPHRNNIAGLPADYFSKAGKIQRFARGIDGERCSDGCLALDPVHANETWLLVGDSHANDMRDEVLKSARLAKAKLFFLIIANCDYSEVGCTRGIQKLDKLLDRHAPTKIFFSSSLASKDNSIMYRLRADTGELFEKVLTKGTSIVFFSNRPRFDVDPVRLALTGRFTEIRLDANWTLSNQTPDMVAIGLENQYKNFAILDQTAALADAARKAPKDFDGHDNNRLPLFRDNNHLSEYGAEIVFKALDGDQ